MSTIGAYNANIYSSYMKLLQDKGLGNVSMGDIFAQQDAGFGGGMTESFLKTLNDKQSTYVSDERPDFRKNVEGRSPETNTYQKKTETEDKLEYEAPAVFRKNVEGRSPETNTYQKQKTAAKAMEERNRLMREMYERGFLV